MALVSGVAPQLKKVAYTGSYPCFWFYLSSQKIFTYSGVTTLELPILMTSPHSIIIMTLVAHSSIPLYAYSDDKGKFKLSVDPQLTLDLTKSELTKKLTTLL